MCEDCPGPAASDNCLDFRCQQQNIVTKAINNTKSTTSPIIIPSFQGGRLRILSTSGTSKTPLEAGAVGAEFEVDGMEYGSESDDSGLKVV